VRRYRAGNKHALRPLPNSLAAPRTLQLRAPVAVPSPSNTQALVIVTVEFDGPSEAMTFTVLVPTMATRV
jgi:hypothetical protein